MFDRLRNLRCIFLQWRGLIFLKHEDMSLRMLDYLIADNNLMEDLKAENLNEEDVCFIKELILGHPVPGKEEFVGRKPCKYFMYQVC